MMYLLAIVIGLVILLAILLTLYPVLGGRPTEDQLRRYQSSPNRKGNIFVYPELTVMEMGLKDTLKVMLEFIKGTPQAKPDKPIRMAEFDPSMLAENTASRVTWFGHSALLLELEGKRLLLDPMFGKAPSPVPIFGGKRFSGSLPFDLDELPFIDAVLLSHDHYDHLDMGTIRRLRHRIGHFFVPLGVKPHLVKWGVHAENISEFDWWEETEFGELKLACTPARHFTGRGLNRNQSLCCSWVIRADKHRVFFSGDSGYGPHFREIGGKYGPFDLTLMECGQYDLRWKVIHMLPEETVQAHLDVGGKVMLPIHWGAFTLAMHAWHDPVERAVKAAERHHVAIATPRIGEPVPIGSENLPTAAWWR